MKSEGDKNLYVSLIGQCFNIFIQAQRVWKYYAYGFPSPYDEKKGRLLQPEDIPYGWIEESCVPHEDLTKKTLESIYEKKDDCQQKIDLGFKLFKWYSDSRCRFLNNKFPWNIGNQDKGEKEVFQRLKDVNLDSRIEVAVIQAKNEIFGRKQNGGTLTDGEIIACFAMHEVLDSKFLLQSYPNVICVPPALREEELHVAKAILELAKSGSEPKKSVLPETKADVGQQEEDVSQHNNYEFSPSVNTWKISFEGKIIYPQDSKGFKYIHYLLNNPVKEFATLVLVREINKLLPLKDNDIYGNMDKEQREGQLLEENLGRSLMRNTSDILDKKAIGQYLERIEEIDEELADTEILKSDKTITELEKEKEQLQKQLTSGQSKDGTHRKFIDEAEKARKSVSKAINESLYKINDERSGHLALWKHFKNTLTIGTSCSYKPETPIPWKL
jgi:hypothetical protein